MFAVEGMPKKRRPFSRVIRAHSSGAMPLISASFRQVWTRYRESHRYPRWGTGAM